MQISFQRSLRRIGYQHAFSLVEVTLAIGIVAFAFTAVLGLIPVGLSSFRGAMETSVGSQIFQQVASDIQQTAFSELSQSRPIRYFNDQGVAKGDSSQTLSLADMAGVVYNVNVAKIPPAMLEGQSSNLATVIIEIVKNPGNKTLERDDTGSILAAEGIHISRYFTYAAAQGQ